MREPIADLLAAGIAADVRPGDPVSDAIDLQPPRVVVAPHDAAAVAAVLAWAADRRIAVAIRGSGTKRAWGRVPGRLDLLLDMRRLNRTILHRHADLTVTVDAGTTLGELNDRLAAHRQSLPLDPPFARQATIGGLLATNDSGPLRHRYGTPRDLVIGIEVATADGHIARAGGQVVKNVAGYDLSKVICGSFGTLAAIVSATFKLLPEPEAAATLVTVPEDGALADTVRRLHDAPLEASRFDVYSHQASDRRRSACLVQFSSAGAAVDAQIAQAQAVVAPAETRVVRGGDQSVVWSQHLADLCGGAGVLVRASWLPAQLSAVLSLLDRVMADGELTFMGRAAVGAGLVRIDGGIARAAAVIERLRDSTAVGNVTVVRGPVELKRMIDVWPPVPNTQVLAALKRALDPHDVLGAGRGPL